MDNLFKNSNSKFARILFRSLGVSCILITTASCSNNEVNKVNGGSEKGKKNGNKNGKKKNKLEHDKEKKDEKDEEDDYEEIVKICIELKREKDLHDSLETMGAKKQECFQLVKNLIEKLAAYTCQSSGLDLDNNSQYCYPTYSLTKETLFTKTGINEFLKIFENFFNLYSGNVYRYKTYLAELKSKLDSFESDCLEVNKAINSLKEYCENSFYKHEKMKDRDVFKNALDHQIPILSKTVFNLNKEAKSFYEKENNTVNTYCNRMRENISNVFVETMKVISTYYLFGVYKEGGLWLKNLDYNSTYEYLKGHISTLEYDLIELLNRIKNLVNNHGLIAFNKTCDSVFLFFQSKSGLVYINEPKKFMSFWSSQWKDYYNKYQNRDQFINEIYSSLHIVKSI